MPPLVGAATHRTRLAGANSYGAPISSQTAPARYPGGSQFTNRCVRTPPRSPRRCGPRGISDRPKCPAAAPTRCIGARLAALVAPAIHRAGGDQPWIGKINWCSIQLETVHGLQSSLSWVDDTANERGIRWVMRSGSRSCAF
jgi:hypothetical protein